MILEKEKINEVFRVKKSQLRKFGTQEKIELLNELNKGVDDLFPSLVTLQNLKNEYNLDSIQKTPGKAVLTTKTGIQVLELEFDSLYATNVVIKANNKDFSELTKLVQDICLIINEKIPFLAIEYARVCESNLDSIKGITYEEGIKGVAATQRVIIPNQPTSVNTNFFRCLKEGLVERLVATSECPKETVEFVPTGNVASKDDFLVTENGQTFVVPEQIVKAISKVRK